MNPQKRIGPLQDDLYLSKMIFWMAQTHSGPIEGQGISTISKIIRYVADSQELSKKYKNEKLVLTNGPEKMINNGWGTYPAYSNSKTIQHVHRLHC